MKAKRARSPAEIGCGWAERKAEMLAGDIPASDWPETWQPDWDEPLDAALQAPAVEMEAFLAVARHWAQERWAEILKEAREREANEEEHAERESAAIRLFERLRGELPRGLYVGRAGERVYVRDRDGLIDSTISSLEDAKRVVLGWKERHTGL